MMLRGFLITTALTMLALGEMKSSAPMEAGAASHERYAVTLGCERERGASFRLASHFTPFHGQVSHVLHSGEQLVLAVTRYVVRDNLFHVRAEKPACALPIGMNHLLVERLFL